MSQVEKTCKAKELHDSKAKLPVSQVEKPTSKGLHGSRLAYQECKRDQTASKEPKNDGKRRMPCGSQQKPFSTEGH